MTSIVIPRPAEMATGWIRKSADPARHLSRLRARGSGEPRVHPVEAEKDDWRRVDRRPPGCARPCVRAERVQRVHYVPEKASGVPFERRLRYFKRGLRIADRGGCSER
jgi:hypothetical protein